MRTEVVKVIKGVMSSEEAIALAVSRLEAEGYCTVRHVGHDRHPDGVRQVHSTWVIQFEVERD